MYNFIKYVVEGKEIKTLEQVALSYARDALEPCLSEQTINYHYGKLYKTYVDRYNNKEGDPDFNEAGAYLHSIYFSQLQIPREPNDPFGKSKEFIENHFKTFDKFKEEFVTAGGIDLKEVNFKTMESKILPNVYFAGEILNIDAITGGFNFQNAWTGGFIVAENISK